MGRQKGEEAAVQRMYMKVPLGFIILYVSVTLLLRPHRARSSDLQLTTLLSYVRDFGVTDWIQTYVGAVGTFMTVFFLWENVRALLIHTPRRLSLTKDYVNAQPPKVDIEEALRYDTPMTRYEQIKIVFFVLTGIVFVRVASFIVLMFFCLLFSYLAGARRGGAPTWRYRVCMKIVHILGAIMFPILGIYHTYVFGEFAPRSKCKLFVANHSCVIEAVLLWLCADQPGFVSRKENAEVIFFGAITKNHESILVDRSAANSREQTLEAIAERATDPTGGQLMIFPEGTTANQNTLFMFKRGAFDAGAPVQMVCITFPYKHFNASWTGRAVGGNSFSDLVLRLCCQFVQHSEMRVLPVYYPTPEEKADSILYANHCQRMMAEVLRENISDATFKDYKTAEQSTKTCPTDAEAKKK